MTESYTDGVTSSLGEGHHRRRKREIQRDERGGLREEIKTAGDGREKKIAPAAWQAFQYCYLEMHDVP